MSTDKPDLATLVAEIQSEMRLQEWVILAEYVLDLSNAEGQAVYGLCTRFLDDKRALIQIRDPESPLPEGATPKTPLEILLHEMTHVRLANLAADPSELNEEQATWPLAGLLFRRWGTDEARAMLRAMSAPGTRGQAVARAMSARAPHAARAATVRRNMNKTEYARALRAALAMEGEEKEGALKALVAQMGEEEEKAPDSERGEKKAADAEPDKPEEKKPVEAAAEPEKPAEQRAQVLTLADVTRVSQRAASEMLERSQLIEANRARMTPAQAAIFSALPLADVKAQVAALPQGAAPAPVKVQPVEAPRGGLSDELASRIDSMMGVRQAPAVAMTRDSRGMTISNLVPLTLGSN